MSECLDAGTGCGWCIPFLKRIHSDPDGIDLSEVDPETYAASRLAYHGDVAAGSPRNAY